MGEVGPETPPLSREIAQALCELFLADGWADFDSETRVIVVDRMHNALKFVGDAMRGKRPEAQS